jgi:hypothetical protein
MQMEKKVTNFQSLLFSHSDKRFAIFENLLNKSMQFLDYEQTFLKEIVQLRSQAKKFKREDDLRAAFYCEEKISQLASKINILFSEFPILNKVEDADKIQEEILDMERTMLDMKTKYNSIVVNYNKTRSSLFFIPLTNCVDRFDEPIEVWRITA